MNYKELIIEVAKKNGIYEGKTNLIINSVFQTITNEMAKGNKVNIPLFGTFISKQRAEKAFRNPANGGEVLKAACNVPKIRFTKYLKKFVR